MTEEQTKLLENAKKIFEVGNESVLSALLPYFKGDSVVKKKADSVFGWKGSCDGCY